MSTPERDRPFTAPCLMMSLPRIMPESPEEDPTAVPLCRKIASMNLTIADHDDRNIVQFLRCASAVPDDPSIFRFQVVDVITRIKENCMEYKASNQYEIPIDHICLTVLYPTMLKPLYDLTKRINGNLMAEMVAEKDKPEDTLRDLLIQNKLDPEIYEVTTADYLPLSMDTKLSDLQTRMNKFPKKYALSLNILRGKSNFFAKVYFRHKDEPELQEQDFFTEQRYTTVTYATTIDFEGFSDDEDGEVFGSASETDNSNAAQVPNASKDDARRLDQQRLNHPDAYDENDDEVNAEWGVVPPEVAGPEAASTGPAYAGQNESDFLAGGDNKFSVLFQHVFAGHEFGLLEDDQFEEDE